MNRGAANSSSVARPELRFASRWRGRVACSSDGGHPRHCLHAGRRRACIGRDPAAGAGVAHRVRRPRQPRIEGRAEPEAGPRGARLNRTQIAFTVGGRKRGAVRYLIGGAHGKSRRAWGSTQWARPHPCRHPSRICRLNRRCDDGVYRRDRAKQSRGKHDNSGGSRSHG
jgi:hypothetical protein